MCESVFFVKVAKLSVRPRYRLALSLAAAAAHNGRSQRGGRKLRRVSWRTIAERSFARGNAGHCGW